MRRKIMLVLQDTQGRVLLTKQNDIYGLPSGILDDIQHAPTEACKLIKLITKADLVMAANLNICIQEDNLSGGTIFELFECKVHDSAKISAEHVWVNEANLVHNLSGATKLFLSTVFDKMELALHSNSDKLE